MYYFCANPKCLFHVNVPENLYLFTVVLPELVKLLPDEGPRVQNTNAMKVTRRKHLWKNPKEGTEWFFCDVCNKAALMLSR